MNAIFLTLFVSLVLALGMVIFFVFLLAQHSHEQSDRLSLLPLQEDEQSRPLPGAVAGFVSTQVRNAK